MTREEAPQRSGEFWPMATRPPLYFERHQRPRIGPLLDALGKAFRQHLEAFQPDDLSRDFRKPMHRKRDARQFAEQDQ
jgi:hypothetical protein